MRDELKTIWEEICGELGGKVGKDVVERWLADAEVRSLKADLVELELPTRLHIDWVEANFRGELTSAFASHVEGEPELVLRVGEGLGKEEEEFTDELLPEEDFVKSRHEKTQQWRARMRAAGLNLRYSMENFVVGENNAYCHAAATSVVERPGDQYNPLLFYGRTGMGKTHLMTAIGQEMLRRHPKKRVLFVTGEQFTNEFIEAIQRGKLAQFRARYRKVDVLLLDDVHFLGGKDSTQDEFFHTFNTLINYHSQLVLTSDRPPSEIPSLEKRLLSRFQWGISAEILPPGVETRIAILRQKAHDLGLEIDSHVLEFLATKIRRNVRNLESALLRISSYNSLYRQRVTVAQAEQYLRELLEAECREAIVTIETIQREVASYFDVGLSELSGRSRTASIVQPRQMAMCLARELTHCSLKEIGRAFGGRDHGTVIHACKKVGESIETPGESKRILDYLRDKITS